MSALIAAEDFRIHIDAKPEAGTPISIRGKFQNRPSAIEEVDLGQLSSGYQYDIVRPAVMLARTSRLDARELTSFGNLIGDLLLPGRVREQFVDALRRSARLRLRIHCTTPWLESIPWELARFRANDPSLDVHARKPCWLAMENPRVWVVRDTGDTPAENVQQTALSRRIGLIDASQALRSYPLTLTFPELPAGFSRDSVITFGDDLTSAYSKTAGDLSVLVFLGHGKAASEGFSGALYMEQYAGAGRATPVHGPELAAAAYRSGASLVVLVACNSGISVPEDDPDQVPGTMVAALTRPESDRHPPMLIGMQHSLEQPRAQKFLDTFLKHLTSGQPVEEAIRQGRLALRGRAGNEAAWSTPVLFLNRPTGQMFGTRQNESSAAIHVPPTTTLSGPREVLDDLGAVPPLIVRGGTEQWWVRSAPLGPIASSISADDVPPGEETIRVSEDGRLAAQFVGTNLQLAWLSTAHATADRFPDPVRLPADAHVLAVARGGLRTALCLVSMSNQTVVLEVAYRGGAAAHRMEVAANTPSSCGLFFGHYPVLFDSEGAAPGGARTALGLDRVHWIDGAASAGIRVLVASGIRRGKPAAVYARGDASTPPDRWNAGLRDMPDSGGARLHVARETSGNPPARLYGNGRILRIDDVTSQGEGF